MSIAEIKIGAAGGNRILNICLEGRSFTIKLLRLVERTTGFEPETSCLASRCSNQLSYVRSFRQIFLRPICLGENSIAGFDKILPH